MRDSHEERHPARVVRWIARGLPTKAGRNRFLTSYLSDSTVNSNPRSGVEEA